MLLRESRPCLSEREKQNTFSVSFFFRESRGFASARGMVVLTRKSRPCLSKREKKYALSIFFFHESHGRASRKWKKTCFLFFPFARVAVLLPREARLCFSESHGRASQKRKKHVFCFFSFHESHSFASARGTGVL